MLTRGEMLQGLLDGETPLDLVIRKYMEIKRYTMSMDFILFTIAPNYHSDLQPDIYSRSCAFCEANNYTGGRCTNSYRCPLAKAACCITCTDPESIWVKMHSELLHIKKSISIVNRIYHAIRFCMCLNAFIAFIQEIKE